MVCFALTLLFPFAFDVVVVVGFFSFLRCLCVTMVETLAEDADGQQQKQFVAETINFSPLDAAHVSTTLKRAHQAYLAPGVTEEELKKKEWGLT